jgi:hypothetical protein
MLGRYQAPPPPSPPPPPPPPADIPEEDDDLYFKEDDDEGHPELADLNTEFRAQEEREAVKEDEAEEDDDDLDFNDDGPNLEKTTEQRAILASYESLKKAKADARAHKEAVEEQLRHALDVSVQRAPTEEAGRCLFTEERQRLLKDAAEHRALFVGIRRERVAAHGGGGGEVEEGGRRRRGEAVERPEGQ